MFLSLSHKEAAGWIGNQMSSFYDEQSKAFNLLFRGHTICLNAFLLIYGISRMKWYRYHTLFLEGGQTVVIHGNIARERLTPMLDYCCEFIEQLVYSIGDLSPTDPEEVHLPYCSRNIDLYEHMVYFLKTKYAAKLFFFASFNYIYFSLVD